MTPYSQHSGVAIICPGRKTIVVQDDIDWDEFNRLTQSRPVTDTPNRLAGSYINDEGDAT